MLYKLPLKITTLAPVVISENSGDNVMTGTSDYICGSVLRGSLAFSYIKSHRLERAEKDNKFYEFFLSNKLHFLPAYPVCANGKASMPLALSLQVNKEGTRLVDLTIDPIEPSLKSLKGFGVVANGVVTKASVKKEIELHMSRQGSEERIIGSSREGVIYNYEYIDIGQTFATAIVGEKELVEAYRNILQEDSVTNLYIGRSKHTQYGKCSLKLGEIEPACKLSSVNGRSAYLYAFSDYLPSNAMFATTEEALAPIKNIIETELKQKLSIGKVFSSIGEQENFVSVWGVKRSSTRSLNAGTLVELVKETEWTDREISIIQELGVSGFGQRRAEGFGVFNVWQPITSKVDQPIRTEANVFIPRPDKFSSEIKETVSKVILNILTERLQKLAYEDISARFKNTKPGKHALARIEEIITKAKDKNNLQEAIVNNIREHGALKKHMENAVLHGISLFEIFEKPNLAPYRKNWDFVVDASIKSLAKDVGCNIPNSDDNQIYYIYWLWYCRIARKNSVGRKEKK